MKKKRRKKVAITGVNTQIFKQANPEYENKNKQGSEYIETPKAEFEKNYRVNLAICLNENPLTKKYQLPAQKISNFSQNHGENIVPCGKPKALKKIDLRGV